MNTEQLADVLMKKHGANWHRMTIVDIAQAAFDAIPDGWAKVGGKWVQVEPCDIDCSEHYDGKHLSATERIRNWRP